MDGPAPADLSGIKGQVDKITVLRVATWNLEVERQQALSRSTKSPPSRGTKGTVGAVTGACGAMAPPGFPAYIVQRESRGDPNARNASSGAYGCAQILPSHFRAGCAGMNYAGCWAYLWAGGRGASNWSTG